MAAAGRRWLALAQELKYHQLEAVRKQAEGWRTGLTGLTTLLSAVLIVKGRDDISKLSDPWPYAVVGLLAVAFVLLVIASLRAVRAASGLPDDVIYLTGEQLRDWTATECDRVRDAIGDAARFTLLGLGLLAIAVGLTWLGPIAPGGGTLVRVEGPGTNVCGTLAGANSGQLVVTPADAKTPTVLAFRQVQKLTVVEKC